LVRSNARYGISAEATDMNRRLKVNEETGVLREKKKKKKDLKTSKLNVSVLSSSCRKKKHTEA